MQKKIIALAIAAAFSAPAFADVTAYGIVDAAVVRASADGQKSDLQAVSGGLATSRFGVKTVEDLNNGMKAVVVLEYGLDSETNSSVGADNSILTAGFKARQQMLAVAGDFGTVATGYLQTTGYDWAKLYDPTAGSAVSPLQALTKGFYIGSTAAAARAQRALAYISPDMGGVTVAVNYSTDLGILTGPGGLGNLGQASAGGDTKVTGTLLSATYNAGPLSVGGVYLTAGVPDGVAKPTEMALGGSYDLGVAKLSATYQSTKTDAAGAAGNSNKVMSFSVVAPVGPGAIVGSVAKSKIKTVDDVDGTAFSVVYLQGLSKLTTMYVAVEKVSQSSSGANYSVLNNALANANLDAGGSSTVLAVGLNKKF